jgi:uncharacterized membrane protein YbhN (UPF0104 family)
MSGRFGTTARIVLGLVVSAVCLWLAVQRAPIAELMEAPSQINYWWVLLASSGTVISLWARGCRWRSLLADRGTKMEYFWAQSIGSLLTNVFPLRAGEAGRVLVVSRRIGVPLVQVGASLVLERALDLAVVLGLLAALLLIMDVPWPVTATGLGLGAALAVAGLGVIVLLLFGRRLTGLVDLVADRLPARLAHLLRDTWSHVLTALDPLRDVWVVAKVVGWSLATWVTSVAAFRALDCSSRRSRSQPSRSAWRCHRARVSSACSTSSGSRRWKPRSRTAIRPRRRSSSRCSITLPTTYRPRCSAWSAWPVSVSRCGRSVAPRPRSPPS